MKLHAEIGKDKHEVEIKHEDGRVFATVGDRHYELETSEPESNVFLFKHEGKIYEAAVSPGRDVTHVRIDTNEFDVRLIDPKRLRGTSSETEHGDGLAEIKTAMPGKVVSILCAVGDEIKKGDGVLVVEAMKMQNELKAPKDGVVKKIRAEEGATVAAGDILAIIE